MKTTSPTTFDSTNYSVAVRTVFPGIMLAAMFLTVSFAANSIANTEQGLLEKRLQSPVRNGHQPRVEVLLHGHSDHAGVSIKDRMTEQVNVLGANSETTWLEKTTVEIPLQNDTAAGAVRKNLRRSLMELLARRSAVLHLHLTIRTAPQHVDTVVGLLEEFQRNSPVPTAGHRREHEFAMSIDPDLAPDTMFIDVLRNVALVVDEESVP